MGCALAAGDVGVLPERTRTPLQSVGKGLSFEAVSQKMIMVEVIEDRISPLCMY